MQQTTQNAIKAALAAYNRTWQAYGAAEDLCIEEELDALHQEWKQAEANLAALGVDVNKLISDEKGQWRLPEALATTESRQQEA